MNAQGIDLRPVFSPLRTFVRRVCHKTRTPLAPVPSRVPSPQLALSEAEGSAYPPHYQRHWLLGVSFSSTAYGLAAYSPLRARAAEGCPVPRIHFP